MIQIVRVIYYDASILLGIKWDLQEAILTLKKTTLWQDAVMKNFINY